MTGPSPHRSADSAVNRVAADKANSARPPGARVHLKLLGSFEGVLEAGQELVLQRRKARALLAYLALNPGQEHSRDKLVSLLWGTSDAEHGRASLRQALSALRKSLGGAADRVLNADGDSVSVNADALDVDATEFVRLAAADSVETLRQCVALYRGDLCEGMDPREPAYEEWLEAERARYRELARAAMVRLLDRLLDGEALEDAVQTALRLLAMDPLQESVHRTLMRLYAGMGRRNVALRQYETCRKTIRRELDVELEPATKQVYLELLRDRGARPESGDVRPAAIANESAAKDGAIADEVGTAKPSRLGFVLVPGLLLLVTVIVGVAIWRTTERAPPAPPTVVESEQVPRPLINRGASVAVLPFTSVGGDSDQDYFSHGISEAVIAELTRFPDLFVIAHNSSSIYRGDVVDVGQVARDLGVRYVLQGSVRKAEGRVRVTAQLVDAAAGRHVWAERYEEVVDDIFAVQDKIVRRVVATMVPNLDRAERERVVGKPMENLEVYEFYLRGQHLQAKMTRRDLLKARQMYERAIELDPDFASAYLGLAQNHLWSFFFGWTVRPDAALTMAEQMAQKALSIDETRARGHGLLAFVYSARRVHASAIAAAERALELNPNDPANLIIHGDVMLYASRIDEAIESLELALRFDPHMKPGYIMDLGMAYYLKGRYDDAVRVLEQSLRGHPDFLFSHVVLAAAQAQAGRPDEAARAAANVRRLHPFFKAEIFGRRYADPRHREHLVEGLRKAGFEG